MNPFLWVPACDKMPQRALNPQSDDNWLEPLFFQHVSQISDSPKISLCHPTRLTGIFCSTRPRSSLASGITTSSEVRLLGSLHLVGFCFSHRVYQQVYPS
jgi:hypothetical protein